MSITPDLDLALLAIGSDGTAEQWDGIPSAEGVLLRWLQQPGLGFPDYGYDVFRASVPKEPIRFDAGINQVGPSGGTVVLANGITLSCPAGTTYPQLPGGTALVPPPGQAVSFTFADPAWYVELRATGAGGTALEATLTQGGQPVASQSIPAGGQWAVRVRSSDTLALAGDGGLLEADISTWHDRHAWTRLNAAPLGLPVTDPAYPASTPAGMTDEQLARSRVPAQAWAARYGQQWSQLHGALKQLIAGTAPGTWSQTGGAATLVADLEELMFLAALDPHVAKILALAYDDTSAAAGIQYAYRLTGRWRGQRRAVDTRGAQGLAALDNAVSASSTAGPLVATSTGAHVPLGPGAVAELGLAPDVVEIDLRVIAATALDWRALDAQGAVLAQGSASGAVRISPAAPEVASIELRSAQSVIVAPFSLWQGIIREDLLPTVTTQPAAAPTPPAWLDVEVEQAGWPGEAAQGDLSWDTPATTQTSSEWGGDVLYQVAAHQINETPDSAQPAAPAFSTSYLLEQGAGVLPTADGSTPFYLDLDLQEGWRAWWCRAVDLFGRVSQPSTPAIAAVHDTAPPPPPQIVLAEYLQGDLPQSTQSLLAPSWLGAEWEADNPGAGGITVGWAWTPELQEQCGDVDGFRVYARAVTDTADAEAWTSTTGMTPIAALGPLTVVYTGTITGLPDTLGSLTVNAVATDDGATESTITTNLELDTGAGALIGATLSVEGVDYTVLANGDGPTTSLTLSPAMPSVPASAATLSVASSALALVECDVPAANLDAPFERQVSGVLDSDGGQLMVLGRRDATFVCRRPVVDFDSGTLGPVPAAGTVVSWYPTCLLALADTGFGPQPSAAEPVASGQVTVTAVRTSATEPRESVPATPGRLTAVYAQVPSPPSFTTDVALDCPCAYEAKPADWYGRSQYELTWQIVEGSGGTIVQRAMFATIQALDLVARPPGTDTAVSRQLDDGDVPADVVDAAHAEIDALDRTIADGDAGAISSAYANLSAAAQMLIATQAAVAGAFSPLQSTPLSPDVASFVDDLPGRSSGRWLYRFVSISPAGLLGDPSPPTPPVCCPDVVAPLAPTALGALSGQDQISITWRRSPDTDVSSYLILRAEDAASAGDARDMEVIATLSVTSPTNHPESYVDTPAWGTWCYRVAAVDAAGNQSPPSDLLSARSLLPVPAEPTWLTPIRDSAGVHLSWSNADGRLSCVVERKGPSVAIWMPISGWLARGEYDYLDAGADPTATYDYRLRVRDHAGQACPDLPVLTVGP